MDYNTVVGLSSTDIPNVENTSVQTRRLHSHPLKTSLENYLSNLVLSHSKKHFLLGQKRLAESGTIALRTVNGRISLPGPTTADTRLRRSKARRAYSKSRPTTIY